MSRTKKSNKANKVARSSHCHKLIKLCGHSNIAVSNYTELRTFDLDKFKDWLLNHGRDVLSVEGDEILKWKHSDGIQPTITNTDGLVSCNDMCLPSLRIYARELF